MSGIGNFVFATEVHTVRPYTSPKTRNTQDLNNLSPYDCLKDLKEKAKQIEKTYKDEMKNRHKVQRSLDHVNRQSLLKRDQFLKIYENKKAKYHSKQLLEVRKKTSALIHRNTMNMVKQKKLQNELQLILTKNQQQNHVISLQIQAKRQKQLLQKKKQLRKQYQQSFHHHDQIKKAQTQYLIRKKNIQTSVSMRSRHNYMAKVLEEMELVGHYEKIFGEIEQMRLCEFEDGSLQTIQSGKKPGESFFTTNNTISC